MKTLFFVLALAQLVPVWAPVYFPSEDGPEHLYNAWAMREIVLGHDNAVTRTYAIDPRPHPNYVSHVALALLLGVFIPSVADKILVSAIILLFLGSVWMFGGTLDAGARLYAFLALPLAHHQLLQLGFYNFCIGFALSLIAITLWWRRRNVAVAALLLLCYFAHPLPTVIAIAAIGILWLTNARNEPARLLPLIPVLPLLAWYALHAAAGPARMRWMALQRVIFIVETYDIVTFHPWQAWIGLALFVTTVALMIVTAVRRPKNSSFLLLALAALILFAVAPPEAAGGAFVLQRLALYVAILPLPWLTPELPRAARIALVIALSIVAAGHAVFLTLRDRQIARETTELVRAAQRIPPQHTFLPLIGDRRPAGTFLSLLGHASSWAAIDRCLVDLDNHQPHTHYFPLTFRSGVPTGDPWEAEATPATIDVDRWAPLAEYVFTWHLKPDAPVFANLARRYALVWSSKNGRIYRRL